jgi:hypothetical protein
MDTWPSICPADCGKDGVHPDYSPVSSELSLTPAVNTNDDKIHEQ